MTNQEMLEKAKRVQTIIGAYDVSNAKLDAFINELENKMNK